VILGYGRDDFYRNLSKLIKRAQKGRWTLAGSNLLPEKFYNFCWGIDNLHTITLPFVRSLIGTLFCHCSPFHLVFAFPSWLISDVIVDPFDGILQARPRTNMCQEVFKPIRIIPRPFWADRNTPPTIILVRHMPFVCTTHVHHVPASMFQLVLCC